MEGEVVAVKKFFIGFLVIVFCCCVYVHGEDERFSVEEFLKNITKFEDMPSMEDIADFWTDDSYFDPYDGGNPILEGLDSVRIFFVRLSATVVAVIDMFVTVFKNAKYLLPWNSTVEV